MFYDCLKDLQIRFKKSLSNHWKKQIFISTLYLLDLSFKGFTKVKSIPFSKWTDVKEANPFS